MSRVLTKVLEYRQASDITHVVKFRTGRTPLLHLPVHSAINQLAAVCP